MLIVAPDSTVTRSFNTTQFSSGAPFTLAGTPSMHARVNGSATQVTAGFTLTADFDSITGENQWVLDLSASASYTAGAIVEVFIAAGTVDSVSAVGIKVYEFQIGTTKSLDAAITDIAAINTKLGTIQDLNTGATVGDNLFDLWTRAGLIQTDTGTLEADWADGGRLDLILDARAAQTTATNIDNIVTANLAAIAKIPKSDGTVSWNATARAAINAEVDTAISDAALATAAELAKVPKSDGTASWNATAAAQIQSEANDALVAYGASTLNAAGIRTAVGLAAANLDTQLGDLPTLAEIFAGGDIDGFTLEESMKLILSSAAAKLSGAATTTIIIRAADDSKDRITATVDADGNRSAITLDAAG